MISDEERAAARQFMPPMLYIPATHLRSPEGPSVVLRRLEDGRLALYAYTALDRLARCMGDQAWLLYPAQDLDSLQEQTGYEVILLDPELPAVNLNAWEDDE